MADLSDKTIKITLAVAGGFLLLYGGFIWNTAVRVTDYEARLTAIETRRNLDAEDISTLEATIKELITSNSDVKVAIATLTTRMDEFNRRLDQQVSVRSSSSTSRVTFASSPPQTVYVQPSNPQEPEQSPQEEPQPRPLQPAVNVVQKILDEVGMLL